MIRYLRLVKFQHSIFALPFLIGGVLLAPGWKDMDLATAAAVLVAMVSARNAAMAYNRAVDARFDAENPRTRKREIPAGILSARSVYAFTIANAAVFIAATYAINEMAFALSVPVLILLFGYSHAKRFTWLCHYILGAVIGMAPAAGWVAVSDSMPGRVLLLSGALMFYIAGFDILYAIQDIDFDRKKHLYSIPARFGVSRSLWIARMTHMTSFLFFIAVGAAFSLDRIYWICLFCIGGLMIYEQSLVSDQNLERIPFAFFHVNSMISVVVGVAFVASAW